ncbi:BCL5p [Sarocladium implicatum]|nr:BCL5p [Sarocladium implicatum]
MDSIWRMFGQGPARVDTDDIYPLHLLDDTKTLRGIVVTWTLRFDDVLSPDRLHNSLSRLLNIGDWKKLGGRLRLNDKGGLEIHVPRQFSTERPAVAFSCDKLNIDIDSHELARHLPRATDDLSVQPSPEYFRAFAAQQSAPQTLNDFIHHDVPLISLHTTIFSNATLVGLSWPHVLMDVMGQQALLRAWSSVLSGHDCDVLPVLGAREDALCTAANAPGSNEDFEMGKQQLKGTGLISFGLRYAWSLIAGPAAEAHTIYMPATALAALRHETEVTLSDTGSKLPYLSDNDILTAWAAKIVASSQSQPRPITVLHAVNARFRLRALSKAPGVFIQNMAIAGFTILSADEASGPLGPIALTNRQQIGTQATEGQVRAFVQELQRDAGGGDPRLLCGPSDAVLMPLTNWERADVLSSADFSGAVIRPGKSGKPGVITYHHPSSMSATTHNNLFVVIGKDIQGGYWLTAHLTKAGWEAVANSIDG